MRRVCASAASISACSGSLCSDRATLHTLTPRGLSDSQGMRFDGNSSAPITTLSPADQGKPCATTDSASEVFLRKAMSFAEGALTNLAQRARNDRSLLSHVG